jgi:hypothetical protein
MRRSTRPRGFTIILAITLLGLIAVAAAMIVHQLGYELHRTRAAYEDAQLRQLLLAGAQEVATHGEDYGQQKNMEPQHMELPVSLTSEDTSITFSFDPSHHQTGTVLIVARIAARQAGETLHWDEQSHQWTVVPPPE